MPLSDSLDEVNQYIVDFLQGRDDLGLTDVWYGETQNVPRTPSVSVDPRNKRRTVTETGHMVRNDFEIVLTLFHSRLTSGQVMMQECLQHAEALETVLHEDRKLGGLIIYGYVGALVTGFTTRNKVIMKSAQLTWSGFSKTRLI